MTKPIISIIVACDKNRAIGKAGTLPWDIPSDLKRFKNLTTGHPVIMGRKTWESIPEKFRPLPERTNIIVTRDKSYVAGGALITTSIEKAVDTADASEGREPLDSLRQSSGQAARGKEIFIIGGGEIFKQVMPFVDRLYVTEVDTQSGGDVFFPEYKSIFTKKISEESGEYQGLKYSYLILER